MPIRYMEDHHVELPIPGEDFTQNDAYDAGKAPTRSDPRELEQVRKRHREEMEEVDEDPDSGPVSPILLPQRPKRQCMIPTLEGVSERMNAFLNPPDKEDNSVELILDEDTREYTPPAKKVDLVRYIHENPVGDEEESEDRRVQVHNLCNVKYAPRFDFDDVFKTRTDSEMIPVSDSPPSSTEVMKQVPERSGSTTRENTPASEIRLEWMDSFQLFQERQKDRFGASLPSDDPGGVDNFNPSMQDRMNASEKAKPLLMFLAGQTLHADMIAALDEIAEEISACEKKYGSHVSESSQSEDEPELNIRGRLVSANSLMGID